MIYLMQVLTYMTAMLLIYGLFLRNKPLYQFSRLYLLACAVLPLFIPLLQMPVTVQQQIQKAVPANFFLPTFTISVSNKIAVPSGDIPVLLYGYAIVALLFAAWQLLGVNRLWKVIKSSKKEKYGSYTLVTNSGYGPGSVGRFILFPGEEVNETILAHEQAHISLHHTRDLIFLNILQAILWPNPLLLWIKKELKEVHEFQADALVNPDKEIYAQLLLSSVFNTHSVPIMHSFIIHPIKRRIIMLQKNGKAAPLRTAVQVCGALTLFMGFAVGIQSCTKKAGTASSEKQSMEKLISNSDKTKPVPTIGDDGVYKIAEKMPRFNIDMATFLEQNLRYPESAKKMGLEGMVIVKFIVDEYGNVKHPIIIKSPDAILSNEAIRAISLMPRWTPGENNGKPVAVYFTLPVLFQLENK